MYQNTCDTVPCSSHLQRSTQASDGNLSFHRRPVYQSDSSPSVLPNHCLRHPQRIRQRRDCNPTESSKAVHPPRTNNNYGSSNRYSCRSCRRNCAQQSIVLPRPYLPHLQCLNSHSETSAKRSDGLYPRL